MSNKIYIIVPLLFLSVFSISLYVLNTIENKQNNSTKYGIFEVKLNKDQKKAYREVYPDKDLSTLAQLSGKVLEVNENAKSIKIKIKDNTTHVIISKNWHGNILKRNTKTNNYFEKNSFNSSQIGWNKIFDYLKQSKKVLLMCSDNTCKESISGHIYID